MNRQYDHRARPWRDPDEPGHVECLVCSDPIRPAGTTWRHAHENADAAPDKPLPADEASFGAAMELSLGAVRDLPPGVDDAGKVRAALAILYWRGALRPSQGSWRRPDQRRARRLAA